MTNTTNIELWWDSTKLLPRQSTARGSRGAIDPVDFGEAFITRWPQPIPYGHGAYERGWVAAEPRRGVMVVLSKCRDEDDSFDEIEALNAIFRVDTTVDLRLRTEHYGGGTYWDRYLSVRRVVAPSWASGSGERTVHLGQTGGAVVRYPVMWEALYPWWRLYGTADTDAVDLRTTLQSTVISVSGDVWVGALFDLASLSATWTSILITNATTGPEGESGGSITWGDSVGFSNGDELDYKHTEPHLVTWEDGTTVNDTGYIKLWPGSNTIQVTGTKSAGTPSADVVNVTWRPAYQG